MDIENCYSEHFEQRLKGRFITSEMILPILDSVDPKVKIEVVGSSELDRPIHLVRIGNGKKVVFGWSQMHGNESTTTKALFDFIQFYLQKECFQEEIAKFEEEYSFYFIPILNPDGAAKYTRENCNDIDLNRDAQSRTQKETQVLMKVFDRLKPELCLNLHGQRTIYGLDNRQSASLSFLSPSANMERSVTAARVVGMSHIARMTAALRKWLPQQIGRYDDGFNANCVGDTFQMKGVPTILFEAGHVSGDYKRERIREYILYAYLTLFGIIGKEDSVATTEDYFRIPENRTNFKDIIIRNAKLGNMEAPTSFAIQFEEKLEDETIIFIPVVETIGDLSSFYGHREYDMKGEEILVNSYANVFVNDKISTIVAKSSDYPIFSLESFF